MIEMMHTLHRTGCRGADAVSMCWRVVVVLFCFLGFCEGAADLPSDFPEIQISVCSNATPGVIFLSNLTQETGVSNTPYLIILNTAGQPETYRKLDSPINTDFKRQPNGDMTYFHLKSTNLYSSNTFSFVFLDAALNATGTISAVATGTKFSVGSDWYTDVHELRMQDNGHGYLLAYRLGRRNMLPFGGSLNAMTVDMAIQEVDPQGILHWEWQPPAFFTPSNSTPDVALDASPVDYAHCNAIEVEPDGNLMLSTRFFDEVTKINRETGDIIWRMGGSACSNNWFAFVNDDQPQAGGGTFTGFSHQHGIRRLKNGHILLFDNGNLKNPPNSRAVEYALDEVNRIATNVWEYHHDPEIQSTEMGYAQRLDNGNTLICWGGNTNGVALTEVTAGGETVFEMSLPAGVHSYRAYKYPLQRDTTGMLLLLLLAE
ncbi:MAG: hypothetical protein EOL87_02625 [Spartobacteria bacterium]|nr:hypothetical protein [Spartobacteria bacterium]